MKETMYENCSKKCKSAQAWWHILVQWAAVPGFSDVINTWQLANLTIHSLDQAILIVSRELYQQKHWIDKTVGESTILLNFLNVPLSRHHQRDTILRMLCDVGRDWTRLDLLLGHYSGRESLVQDVWGVCPALTPEWLMFTFYLSVLQLRFHLN